MTNLSILLDHLKAPGLWWVLPLVLAAAGAHAGEWQMDALLAEDRYEAPAVREGAPELMRGNVAPGLLSETGTGVYTTDARVSIGFGRETFPLTYGVARLAHGIRLYDFTGAPAHVALTLEAGKKRFAVKIAATTPDAPLACSVAGEGMAEQTLTIPRTSLPADVTLYLRDNGDWEVQANGLADASRKTVSGKSTVFGGFWIDGKGYPKIRIRTELVSDTPGLAASVRVDNHVLGIVSPAEKIAIPCIVRPDDTFDPVRAGWKKTFDDAFDGTNVNWNNWYYVPKAGPLKFGERVRVDGKGTLEIIADYGPDGKTLMAPSLRSKPMFGYGYYEARLKLTRQNGWWAAFWLYGRLNSDPFVDGYEIDIFEDYYTRRLGPEGHTRPELDHNLHMYLGTQLKSWNYGSFYEGSFDDWIVLGCKRTPFEISYYLNGRIIRSAANHSNWGSVTFDAFDHAAGNVPLCIILSAQVMGPSWTYYDKTNAAFPESFKVDYVRFYEMPRDAARLPSIRWTGEAAADDGTLRYFDPGATMRFSVDAQPSAVTRAKIKAVYLFDAGYLLGYATNAPYAFDVTLSKEGLAKTRYMRTGRQKVVPDLNQAPHSFVAYVQDENGAIAETGRPIRRHPKFHRPQTRPYGGVAQPVPGPITWWKYDEGGEGVAYHDATRGNQFANSPAARRTEGDVDCTTSELASTQPGEWVNYTVDVARAGTYEATLKWGTAHIGTHEIYLVLDGRYLGTFELVHADDRNGSWSASRTAKITVTLPAGRHVLALDMRCQLTLGAFKLTEVSHE